MGAAIGNGASLILGPLFAGSVAAVAPAARAAGVKVIAFSNDEKVAGDGVFTMGFLPREQVRRVINYAIVQGRRRFAVLAPNNVPRVQERSERSGRSERSERAEQCSERSRTWWPRWAVGRGICGQDQHADLGYISCCCVGWHHSKPKSKLTSPDFNMLTFGVLG